LQNGNIIALRASNGSVLWHYTSRSFLSELPPYVADASVYVIALHGSIDALRAGDGSLLWHASLHALSDAPTMIATGGMVYVGTQDGSVEALRASDGSLLWLYKDGKGSAVSTTISTVAQGVVYIGLQAGDIDSIAALRASDGFLLWRYIPQIPSTQLFPILADNILLLALQDGSIDALRASSGILLWHYPVNSWHL